MKHIIFKTLVSIWNMLPFKIFMAKILHAFPTILKKLYKDLRFKGCMTVRVEDKSFKLYNPGFTTIENELFWFGLDKGWEKISMKIWIELSKKANTVLDVGANSGVYSLVASSINSNAKVYAFEPVKRTSELFKKNLKLNSTHKIQLIEKAVSNTDGYAKFYDMPSESQYSASLNAQMLALNANHISYEIATIRLDALDALKNEKIDLIKLDVEMHEPEALEGMISIIKRNRPYLLIEILTQEIASKIEQLFSLLDYQFYNINEVNIPHEVKNLTASDHYNYLFVPRDKAINFDFIEE